MNSELPEANNHGQSLDQRYADKPHMRQRLLEIADMIDELVTQGCTAHEAEARAIEEIRKLGNGILTEWAEKTEAVAAAKARAQDATLQPYRKKSPDLALHLRRDSDLGATAASWTSWCAGAAVL